MADAVTSQIPADEKSPMTTGPEDPFSKEDREYLSLIADIVEDMKPFDELMALSKRCPDPDRYGENEG